MEREHHDMGMSRWPAWAQCPHWDPAPAGKLAEDGTEAHEALEALMMGAPCATQGDLLEAAEWARGELVKYAPAEDWELESRVQITRPGRLSGIYGRADAILPMSRHPQASCIVADFKAFGGRDKEADYWPQMAGYAVAVADEYEMDNEDIITLLILQGGARRVDARISTVQECVRISDRVIGERIRRESFDPVPCRWCRYCAQNLTCTALMGVVDRCASAPPTFAAEMDAAAVADSLCKVKLLEGWIEAIKARGLELAREQGGRITGAVGDWRLQERKAPAKVKDALQAFQVVKEWITPAHYLGCASIHVGALERALKAAGVDPEERQEIIEAVSERGDPSVSLVKC